MNGGTSLLSSEGTRSFWTRSRMVLSSIVFFGGRNELWFLRAMTRALEGADATGAALLPYSAAWVRRRSQCVKLLAGLPNPAMYRGAGRHACAEDLLLPPCLLWISWGFRKDRHDTLPASEIPRRTLAQGRLAAAVTALVAAATVLASPLSCCWPSTAGGRRSSAMPRSSSSCATTLSRSCARPIWRSRTCRSSSSTRRASTPSSSTAGAFSSIPAR